MGYFLVILVVDLLYCIVMVQYCVVFLFGDGIGFEIIVVVCQLLEVVSQCYGFLLSFEEQFIGGSVIDVIGELLFVSIFEVCKLVDVVLLVVIGSFCFDSFFCEKWLEIGLFGLCVGMELFVNLWLVKIVLVFIVVSSFKCEVIEGVDLMVVWEFIGGIYFG